MKLLTIAVCACAIPVAAQRPFDVDRVNDGLSSLYPYRIRVLDPFGNPTSRIIEIRERSDLASNLTPGNDVLPVPTLPITPRLPNGAAGNQFVQVRFTEAVDRDTLITGGPTSRATSFLTGALLIAIRDPATGAVSFASGRPFVGGWTYFDDPNTPAFDPQLVRAVDARNGQIVVRDARASGFPRGFAGDTELVDDNALVFVADADGDLSTFETFPIGQVLNVRATRAIASAAGTALRREVCTATSAGPDPAPLAVLATTPVNNQANVDPRTLLTVTFDRPVQPGDVGRFLTPGTLPGFGAIAPSYVVNGTEVPIVYHAEPVSVGDLCRYVIRPVHALPGRTVTKVTVVAAALRALSDSRLAQSATFTFLTGAGPGLVNAPVAPEAVYIGLGGAEPGIAVVDLNGFGQGTGDPAASSLIRNPNLGVPGVVPALSIGSSSIDGGGQGPLTLTRDHTGSVRVIGAPLIGSATDIQIGQPLDLIYNNSNINPNASGPNHLNPETLGATPGNTISIAPHPNPPRLVVPLPNPAANIAGEEPTVTTSGNFPGRITTRSPPCLPSPINLLVPGNPFGPLGALLGANFPGVFYGPQPAPASPPPPLAFCPFTSRQQVGHFLYALDTEQRAIHVLNSNRFTLLWTFWFKDPTDIAISPNLKWLAVSDRTANTVSLIDVDPLSPTFQQILARIPVMAEPGELRWQPGAEDLFVAHPSRHAVSIISGTTGLVRRVLRRGLFQPLAIAVTHRRTSGYLAYVLNLDGRIVVYDSATNAMVAAVPGRFAQASAIQPDPGNAADGAWVVHRAADGSAVASLIEPLPGTARAPQFGVTMRLTGMSGDRPIDLAFDDVENRGALRDDAPGFVPFPARHSGKAHAKVDLAGQIVPASNPRLLFVALADSGTVDVFDLATRTRLTTIDAPGVTALSHYWRQ